MFETLAFFSFSIRLPAPASTSEAVFEVTGGEEVKRFTFHLHTFAQFIPDMQAFFCRAYTSEKKSQFTDIKAMHLIFAFLAPDSFARQQNNICPV